MAAPAADPGADHLRSAALLAPAGRGRGDRDAVLELGRRARSRLVAVRASLSLPRAMPRPLPPRGARLRALAGGAAGRRAAATLGLSPTPPPALSPDPYTILGVEPGVSDEE